MKFKVIDGIKVEEGVSREELRRYLKIRKELIRRVDEGINNLSEEERKELSKKIDKLLKKMEKC